VPFFFVTKKRILFSFLSRHSVTSPCTLHVTGPMHNGDSPDEAGGGNAGSVSCADALAYCWKLLLEQVLAVMPVCTFLALFQVTRPLRGTGARARVREGTPGVVCSAQHGLALAPRAC